MNWDEHVWILISQQHWTPGRSRQTGGWSLAPGEINSAAIPTPIFSVLRGGGPGHRNYSTINDAMQDLAVAVGEVLLAVQLKDDDDDDY